jgi:Flp pilus assembly protein TadG
MRRRRSGESGAIAIMVALLTCFVLFGIAALVVDLGLARDTKQASQIASDASALAAATALYPDNTGVPNFPAAVTAAKTYAEKNFGVDPTTSWTNCSDDGAQTYQPDAASPVQNHCISFDDATQPTKVRVVMPQRTIPAGFGGVYGVSTYTISTDARAVVNSPVSGSCALCFLGDVNTNNSDFTVAASSIAVDGNITSGPNSVWTAGSILVAGTVNGQDPDAYSNPNYTPHPQQTAPFADPFASLTMPATPAAVRGNLSGCNATIQPGVWGNVSLGNNDTCTLSPGLYVITGLWQEGNHSVLKGSGVTLYFTCGTTAAVRACTSADPAGTGGRLDAKNGALNLAAGAAGYSSFVILYDRLNPNDLELQGNGGTEVTGGIYAPNASMTFNGTSKFGVDGGPVVVKSADGVGNGSGISVTNATSTNLTSDPSPASLDR